MLRLALLALASLLPFLVTDSVSSSLPHIMHHLQEKEKGKVRGETDQMA
jgi:hypothetical protein